MVVWTDDFDTIIPLAREFEEKLIKLVWQNRVAFSAPNSTLQTPVDTSSDVRLNEKTDPSTLEPTARDRAPKKSKWNFGWRLSSTGPAAPKDQDPEKGVPEYTPRRMRMFAPFYNGFGCALSLCISVRSQTSSRVLTIPQSSSAVVSTSSFKSSLSTRLTTGSVC